MTGDRDPTGSSMLPPEAAFGVLGNEVRMELLRVLGEAEGPLAFSTLRSRLGVDDPGRFNYHLDKLVGHFVEQRDDGYVLRRPGERIVEAIRSGAITEAPVIEPTPIDLACHFCGAAPLEMEYREGEVGVYCTECAGLYGGTDDESSRRPAQRQRLWYSRLPPAGIRDRSPEEVLFTSVQWTQFEIITAASGMCPSCSARLEHSFEVCPDHAADDGLCHACNRRYAAVFSGRCTNCVFTSTITLGPVLLRHPPLRAFLIDHGLDPMAPRGDRFRQLLHGYEEEIVSADPFSARVTYFLEDESFTVAVDADLTITTVTGEDETA